MINLKSQVTLQTLTQLGARAFMYAAMLVVLPSFISITDSATYADIVLLSTLAAVSAQLDGGHATELVITLSSGANQLSREHVLHAVKRSLLGTFQWSITLSTVFSIIWLTIAPLSNNSHNPLIIFISGVVLASTCALANTATRVLFAKGFSLSSSFVLIGGPFTGFIFILVLRWTGLGTVPWIAASFVAGYLFVLIGTLAHLHRRNLPGVVAEDNIVQNSSKNSTRRWVFVSQIISIVLAAKNPFLIRLLRGDSELGLFSVYSACFSLMLAPAAAMQIPVLVRFKCLITDGDKKGLSHSIYRQLAFSIFASLSIGLVVFIILSTDFAASHFSKFEKINRLNLALVVASATVASSSVILAVYLTAVGRLRLLAWMGVLVLVVDTVLVFSWAKELGGVTPMLTIIVANVLATIFFVFFRQK